MHSRCYFARDSWFDSFVACSEVFFFFFLIIFIELVLAAQGPRCCAQGFSGLCGLGCSLAVLGRLLIAATFLVEHRFWALDSVVAVLGLSCPAAVKSVQTRD